jgi:alpha-methylacyl-CoA racemase
LDRNQWPHLRSRLAAVIKTKTRDEWASLAEGTDACLSPVLTPWEAADHPHNKARGTFVDVGGVTQPAPAPRFDRTPADVPAPPHEPGADTTEVLAELGLSGEDLDNLRSNGIIA